MSNVVDIRVARRANRQGEEGKGWKITITTLALAIEYYTFIEPDPEFVAIMEKALHRRTDCVCLVSEETFTRVSEDLPLQEALAALLYD